MVVWSSWFFSDMVHDIIFYYNLTICTFALDQINNIQFSIKTKKGILVISLSNTNNKQNMGDGNCT